MRHKPGIRWPGIRWAGRAALLACCIAPLLASPWPARADALSDIYQLLQQQPQNVDLNLRYADAAEQEGKLKWALPAYERVLAVEPGNKAALDGIARIKKKLREEAPG